MTTAAVKNRRRRLTRRFWAVVLIMGAVVVLLFTVFPTRTFLSQRRRIDIAHEELRLLKQENASLDKRSQDLQSDATIERIAREDYNLVLPGEQAYSFLPSAPKKKATEDAKKKEEQRSWFSSAVDAISFWN